MSTPKTRDPLLPAFWDERFEQGVTPWDSGRVPEALKRFASTMPPSPVLIPGCGSGHEVAWLSKQGWPVTAIDFSPAAVASARSLLGPWADRVVEADFFDFTPPDRIAVIYERAFLCAMPRSRWRAIAGRWAALLPRGGLLAGFFFFDGSPKGPPFGMQPDELNGLLQTDFEQIERLEVADSIPVFKGKEQWQVWRRIAD